MRTPRRFSRREFAVMAASGGSALVAACASGSNGDQTDATDAAATPTATPTDASNDSTSTTAAPTTTAPATTTTTEPPPPVYPLTGLPATDPAVAARVALVVKIDNAPGARPQTGFNAADIVVEEIVNDNLTRFAMVFQSTDSNPVGPIRSGRLQDIDLFSVLNRPLFAWSGGNRTVTDAIRASDLIDIGPNVVPAYFRSDDRSVPHNLYSSTPKLREFTPPFTTPPPQLFRYRGESETPTGVPSSGVAIKLDSIDVVWTWDAASGTYLREMERDPHNDAAGGQVNTHNVLVLVVEYAEGISGSPDAQTLGSGEAHLFSAGNYVHGTWARDDIRSVFDLIDDDGAPMLFTPGRTFIELPRPISTLPLPA